MPGSNCSSVSGTRWWGYRSASGRPASSRAVIATSSKPGWRQRIEAAIAPAYPLAPTTATLGTDRPPDRGERADDAFTDRGDLLVGERAVGSAELEVQRERD